MHKSRFVVFVVTAMTLAGCTTTGGIIANLFPAPKFLEGEINNNIYTAQDKTFSVAVPHKVGSYEYTYMQVKEQYFEYGAYVSFGPAAFDQSIYRIETARRVTPGSQRIEIDNIAPKIVEKYKAQLEKAYGAALQNEESHRETINGRSAYFWKFIQVAPIGKYFSNKTATLTHYVYIIDFEEKGAVIVWVQVPEATKKIAMEPRAFAESVVMYGPAQAGQRP